MSPSLVYLLAWNNQSQIMVFLYTGFYNRSQSMSFLFLIFMTCHRLFIISENLTLEMRGSTVVMKESML